MTGKKTKVFGIGFHKTATSSLGHALEALGYRVCGARWVHEPDVGTTYRERGLALVEEYDAVQDNPWPLLYRELDEAYPGSRFVLTHRPDDAWMKSALRHFTGRNTPMREHIYGHSTPVGHEDIYLERYKRHNAEVREYFADRPDDFLTMDITSGDGWDLLCPFLGEPIPDIPFPRSNSAADRERLDREKQRLVQRTLARLRRLIGR